MVATASMRIPVDTLFDMLFGEGSAFAVRRMPLIELHLCPPLPGAFIRYGMPVYSCRCVPN